MLVTVTADTYIVSNTQVNTTIVSDNTFVFNESIDQSLDKVFLPSHKQVHLVTGFCQLKDKQTCKLLCKCHEACPNSCENNNPRPYDTELYLKWNILPTRIVTFKILTVLL